MRAMKEARHFIEKSPDDEGAQILSRLVLALETDAQFALAEMYRLDMNRFTLALKILQEWRQDRYHVGKARLFDTATYAAELGGTNPATGR